MPKKSLSTITKSNTEEDDNEEYTVESILDKKFVYGIWKYHVKWLGWPKSQSTWEPIENLENSKKIVEEFNRRWPEGKKTEKKSKSSSSSKHKKAKSKPKSAKKAKSECSRIPRKSVKKDEKQTPVKMNSTNNSTESLPLTTMMSQPSSRKRKTKPTPKSDELIMQLSNKKLKTTSSSESKNMLSNDDATSSTNNNNTNSTSILQGHFKYGDRPKKIIAAKCQEPIVKCLVEWEPRNDGSLPLRTNLTNEEIKQYDPLLLVEYYESILKSHLGNILVATGKNQMVGLIEKLIENYGGINGNMTSIDDVNPEDIAKQSTTSQIFM